MTPKGDTEVICIIKRPVTNQVEITGWIIASDVENARRQAYGAGHQQLADWLYRMEGALSIPSKQDVTIGADVFTMLRG